MIKFIKKIRETLKDPKKRAITSLVLYFCFFAFVYFIIAGASDNGGNYIPPSENKIFNYNYTIEIDEKNNKLLIDGIHSDVESFNYKNNNYTISDGIIYLNGVVVDNPIKYNVSDYYYDNIEELIGKSVFVKKTTYNDDSTTTVYNIKVKDFFYNTNYECINNCENNIEISVDEKEFINQVTIDLTSVNNYKYIINIKYSEIKTSDN